MADGGSQTKQKLSGGHLEAPWRAIGKSDAGCAESGIWSATLRDVRKAFDHVSQDAPLRAIKEMGVGAHSRALMAKARSLSKIRARLANKTSEHVNPERGLPQGAVESPIIFAMVIVGIDQTQTESRDSIHAKVGTHLQVEVCEWRKRDYVRVGKCPVGSALWTPTKTMKSAIDSWSARTTCAVLGVKRGAEEAMDQWWRRLHRVGHAAPRVVISRMAISVRSHTKGSSMLMSPPATGPPWKKPRSFWQAGRTCWWQASALEESNKERRAGRRTVGRKDGRKDGRMLSDGRTDSQTCVSDGRMDALGRAAGRNDGQRTEGRMGGRSVRRSCVADRQSVAHTDWWMESRMQMGERAGGRTDGRSNRRTCRSDGTDGRAVGRLVRRCVSDGRWVGRSVDRTCVPFGRADDWWVGWAGGRTAPFPHFRLIKPSHVQKTTEPPSSRFPLRSSFHILPPSTPLIVLLDR